MNNELRERKIYRPDPTREEAMDWINSATTPEGMRFRNEVAVHNMMSRSQIGRYAFVVEETEDGDRLRIDPPLTAAELRILSGVPYFQSVLQEVTDE